MVAKYSCIRREQKILLHRRGGKVKTEQRLEDANDAVLGDRGRVHERRNARGQP